MRYSATARPDLVRESCRSCSSSQKFIAIMGSTPFHGSRNIVRAEPSFLHLLIKKYKRNSAAWQVGYCTQIRRGFCAERPNFNEKVTLISEKPFQNCKNSAENNFQRNRKACGMNCYRKETKSSKTVKNIQKQEVSQIFGRDAQENFFKIVQATDGQNEKDFL